LVGDVPGGLGIGPRDAVGAGEVAGRAQRDRHRELARMSGAEDGEAVGHQRHLHRVRVHAAGAPQLAAGRGVVARDQLEAVGEELLEPSGARSPGAECSRLICTGSARRLPDLVAGFESSAIR
jgi:hypothetical protein